MEGMRIVVEETKRKAYSEVVEILKLIDDEQKLEKLPFEVVELIKGNSDPTYKPQISKEIPIEEQGLHKETYVILGWIANKYWGENILEVEEEKNIQKEIEENKDFEELSKYDIKEEENNVRNAAVFNDIEPEVFDVIIEKENSNLPVLMKEEKWYNRVKNKIISFFRAIFKLNSKKQKEGINDEF